MNRIIKYTLLGLLVVVLPSANLFAATTSLFHNTKISTIYAQLQRKLDTKAATKSWSAAQKTEFSQKKEAFKQALMAFDAAYYEKNKVKLVQAKPQVKKTYSALQKFLSASISVPSVGDASSIISSSVSQEFPSALAPNSVSGDAIDEILYYADSLEGAYTSAGEVFSQNIFSSANCSFGLGSLIQVVSGEKSVVVKNNDRPNCTKHPKMVDLSTVAFTQLAPLTKGRLTGQAINL